MAFAKISQVAHYVPDNIVTNDDLAKIMETSDEWISSRTGIRKRRLSLDESTSDLAENVARQLLEKSGVSAEEIDFIIIATMTPDTMMPSTAAIVQGRIGATKAFAFDLTAACSGFTFALAMSEKLISSGSYQKGLVIGAEVISKVLDWSDRTTAVLFGDGAGGVLLEKSNKQYFLAESLNTDGTRGDSLQLGCSKSNFRFSDESKESYYLKMDGRRVFDFAVREVPKSIQELLRTSEISAENIDYFLFHQANSRILDKMAKKIGVSREKIPENLMSYGNTSAASIPILLSECVAKELIRLDGSQTVLLSGFGGGLTWGNLIVTM